MPRRHYLARHSGKGQSHRVRHVAGVAAFTATALVVSMVGATYAMLQGNIEGANVDHLLGSDRPTIAAPTSTVSDPTDPFGGAAVNILLMGSDSRWGDNATVGGEYDGMRADTTMLVHIAADRSRMDVVSIPRDTMLDIPRCDRTDGTSSKAQFGQFNSAFAIGGQNDDIASAAACAQRTVENLTQIRIDGYVVVDMMGFADVISTLGGVDVCVPKDINLPDWGLVVGAGMNHLDGTTALAYARVRHGIGDGSDIQRIDRQKAVMSAVANKALSSSMLTNPAKMLQFLNATTSTLHASEAMASLTNMAGLGFSLRNMDLAHIGFITAPNAPWTKDHNRVVLTSAADDLWDLLRSDQLIPGSAAWTDAQQAAAGAVDIGAQGATADPGSEATSAGNPVDPNSQSSGAGTSQGGESATGGGSAGTPDPVDTSGGSGLPSGDPSPFAVTNGNAVTSCG